MKNETVKKLHELVVAYGKDAVPGMTFEVEEVTKMNSTKMHSIYVKDVEGIVPMAYIEDYVNDGDDEETMRHAATAIVERLRNAAEEAADVTLDMPSSWTDEVFLTVVNAERNADLLKTVPHEPFMDLAVVYRMNMRFKGDAGINGTAILTNDHLRLLGIERSNLFEIAMKNTRRMMKPYVKSMTEIMLGYGMPVGEAIPGDPLYVASNSENFYGAAVMLMPDVIEELSQKIGGDFYVLPSSVHEVIAISADNADANALNMMIGNVNEEVLRPEEFLSDHAYRYDSGKKKLEVA